MSHALMISEAATPWIYQYIIYWESCTLLYTALSDPCTVDIQYPTTSEQGLDGGR